MKIFLNPLAKLGVFIQLSNEQSLTFSADFNFFADSIYFIPAYDEIFYGTHALPISICIPVIRSNSRLYLAIRFSSNTFSSIPTFSGL